MIDLLPCCLVSEQPGFKLPPVKENHFALRLAAWDFPGAGQLVEVGPGEAGITCRLIKGQHRLVGQEIALQVANFPLQPFYGCGGVTFITHFDIALSETK